MVAGAEEKLRSDINRAFLIGTYMDGRVPVKAQLAFTVVGLRLDVTRIEGKAVDASNFSALVLGVNIVGIGGVRKYPEAVAAIKIFPAAIGDPGRIRRITHP